MRRRLAWQIGAIIVVIGILAASWFLFLSPRLDESAANDELRAETEAQNANLQLDIANLSTIDVAALQSQLAGFSSGIPPLPELMSYIREVWSRTQSGGVTLNSIDLSPAEVFAPAAPGIVPLPIAQEDFEAAVATGLIVVKFSISVTGSYDAIVAAAQSFQADAPRSTLITDIALNENAENPDGASAMITGAIWVLPLAPVTITPASPPPPAPLPTPAPGPTSTPEPTPEATPTPTN